MNVGYVCRHAGAGGNNTSSITLSFKIIDYKMKQNRTEQNRTEQNRTEANGSTTGMREPVSSTTHSGTVMATPCAPSGDRTTSVVEPSSSSGQPTASGRLKGQGGKWAVSSKGVWGDAMCAVRIERSAVLSRS